ncbi:hypothetical protein CMV_026506 [Castanea mollissima]|uniref:Uncharacterized protein n=1 Tax=Castanea mollissima TaxID=60419 RepID=A0A8J4VAC5_9ROSI|nr:hypothetical protein CMV_026506 [Castanea mollissima]
MNPTLEELLRLIHPVFFLNGALHTAAMTSRHCFIMSFEIRALKYILVNGWVDFFPIIECYIEGDEMSMECKIMEKEEY